jgi:hypothetical protein
MPRAILLTRDNVEAIISEGWTLYRCTLGDLRDEDIEDGVYVIKDGCAAENNVVYTTHTVIDFDATWVFTETLRPADQAWAWRDITRR